MKKLSYFLFIFSIVLLILTLAGTLVSNKVIRTETIYASVNVTRGGVGIDVNSSALTFGSVPVKGSQTRNLIFNNENDFPVIVEISTEGSIKKLLIYQDSVKIESGEVKKIPFSVRSGENEEGYYDGNVKLKVIP